jgi:hypothetical protein
VCVLPVCVLPVCVLPVCVLPVCVLPVCVLPVCVLPVCGVRMWAPAVSLRCGRWERTALRAEACLKGAGSLRCP